MIFHLSNRGTDKLSEILWVHAGAHSLFGERFLQRIQSLQIRCDLPDDIQILRRMACAVAASILTKCDVQTPI